MSTSTIEAAPPTTTDRRSGRQLTSYPSRGTRRSQLGLTVVITVALYYALYVNGGVATLMLPALRMPFPYFVGILAIGSAVGAFASLLAGLCDRFGRANLVVWGLLLVALLTLVAIPMAKDRLTYGIENCLVALVEGVILVATPALIRDFSPQVGRATAMGFWTIGPVLGSLMVSLLTTLTLPTFGTWQSQFYICGAFCMVVFVLAALFLRELAPGLRDQVMHSERDRALVEAGAAAAAAAARRESVATPFARLARLDVIGSAVGVSLLLLFYYTAVAFGTIFLVTVHHLDVASANAVGNWAWGTNAVALIVAGVASDKLRVRKPFMLAGGIGALVFTVLWLMQIDAHPNFATLALLASGQSICVAFAYATWMASFTETVEAHDPAATATGLAIWGWIIRLVITGAFVAIPYVIDTVTPLVGAHHVLATFAKVKASGAQPTPELLHELGVIKAAAAATGGQWTTWYWICVFGIAVFLAALFTMRGRWSPAAARADEDAHDAETREALSRLART